ncbi:MAG: hypothetical protein LC135_00640 [Phycisphaerae bacterium]|nr:hypothetical protein [Phycisphaerae bacterium]MCZ2398359.1 hypothetical protein [Phycisphaerae bacterium]
MLQPHWVEGPHTGESLAVSLRAVLASFGVTRPYEELVAVLGLGNACTFDATEPPTAWGHLARDLNLRAAAELYGLRLRELHPRPAAHNLRGSAEFAGHFRDSYVPLIARACDHGQMLLAWRGWPAPRENFWGVIVDVRGLMVVGHTLLHGGQPLPLTGPAHQVYVVEACVPPHAARLAPDVLFRVAARSAARFWSDGADDEAGGVETGGRACDAMCDAITRSGSVITAGELASLAAGMAAARRGLCAWLSETAGAVRGAAGELCRAWLSAGQLAADALLAVGSAGEEGSASAGQAGARASMVAALREVRRVEGALAGRLAGSRADR